MGHFKKSLETQFKLLIMWGNHKRMVGRKRGFVPIVSRRESQETKHWDSEMELFTV